MKVLSYKKLIGTEYKVSSFLIDADDIKPLAIPSNVMTYIKTLNENPEVAILSTWDGTKPFKEFDIPKRKEGYRHIKAPVGVYKYAQAYAMRYLRDKVRIVESEYAYGFVRKKSCKSAVEQHHSNNSNWFLKLDIENFFPSITEDMIIQGIASTVNGSFIRPDRLVQLADLFVDETGHLTQGCISSPYIANIVLEKFDVLLGQWCKSKGIVYTRYADDMCFSSYYQFDPVAVIKQVMQWLPWGLTLKTAKTKFGNKSGVNIILGIHYNAQGNLTVGHVAKHNMKLVAHNWEKLSWEERGHYIGLKTYYKTIEPEYFSQPRFDIIDWSNR